MSQLGIFGHHDWVEGMDCWVDIDGQERAMITDHREAAGASGEQDHLGELAQKVGDGTLRGRVVSHDGEPIDLDWEDDAEWSLT